MEPTERDGDGLLHGDDDPAVARRREIDRLLQDRGFVLGWNEFVPLLLAGMAMAANARTARLRGARWGPAEQRRFAQLDGAVRRGLELLDATLRDVGLTRADVGLA